MQYGIECLIFDDAHDLSMPHLIFLEDLYALISLDGEYTWLEGLLLCAFYLILAVGTFFPPT